MVRAGLLAAGCVAAMAAASAARGQTSSPGPLSSREELARRWDLNADGQIDEAEAEMARAKMRRERIDLLQRKRDARTQPAAAPADPPHEMADELVFPDLSAPPTAKKPAVTDAKKPTPATTKPPPKKDLNAGRLPAGLPPTRGLPAGSLSPGRTGQRPMSPSLTPPGTRAVGPTRPPAARTPSPAPTSPGRPRITAEEIGGP